MKGSESVNPLWFSTMRAMPSVVRDPSFSCNLSSLKSKHNKPGLILTHRKHSPFPMRQILSKYCPNTSAVSQTQSIALRWAGEDDGEDCKQEQSHPRHWQQHSTMITSYQVQFQSVISILSTLEMLQLTVSPPSNIPHPINMSGARM